MNVRKGVALVLALAMAAMPVLAGPVSDEGRISGTAKDEARQPRNFEVRAVDVLTGIVATTAPLDPTTANFELTGLGAGTYMVELFRLRDQRVVCTEGPFQLTSATLMRSGVVIDCRKPWAWWLLGAAGAAGIAAGIAAGGPASPAQ